jgi:hypothetical protein
MSLTVVNAFFRRDFESQNSDDAEEKMAAAVLTSLSLSPVLKNFQFEQGRTDFVRASRA